MTAQSNFDFLKEHDPIFLQLATAAERAFVSDPNTTLLKLRQLGEAFAQDIAARSAIAFDHSVSQLDLLARIDREIRLDPTIRSLFHTLRVEGNKATHQFQTQHREAIDGLRVGRALAIWYHQSFGKRGASFKPGPFVAPVDPSRELRELQAQIEQLNTQLREASQQADDHQQLAELTAREKSEYAELAEQMDADARTYEQLARETEQKLAQQQREFEARVQALQQQLQQQSAQAAKQVTERAGSAAAQFDLDEDLTRILIDQQLIDAGWEADSTTIRFDNGARPQRGKNIAIAEWPTGSGPADYVLFAGLTPIAVVEAKRERVNVAGKILQAERYARTFKPRGEMNSAWMVECRTIAWPDANDGHYQIPFVYACNGRAFVKQLAESSGTWFRDVRDGANTARPLQDFHSPDGLLDLLKRNKKTAEEKLQQEGFAYPSIAITVDLLTTGIDVPKICNLVFLRRVRSRILYEQMIGRATRRCDEIGKTVFHVYDPVDLYAALQDVSTMQPLVKNPNVTLEQLAQELADPKSFEAAGTQPGSSHAQDVLDALSQKVMRVLRKAEKKADEKPPLRAKLDELKQLWGVPPARLHTHLHELGPRRAADFVQSHGHLVAQINAVADLLGSDYRPLIAEHADQLMVREQSYGQYKRPADYLDSFNTFIRDNINSSVALGVVVNKPKDLTRAQLREIKLLLDANGYSEANLQSAWCNQTNQEIAAGIVGHIRRAALGEALIPFDRRVDTALQKIYALHPWTTAQRKWLDRLGKGLKFETVVDTDYFNRNFTDVGGAKGLDRALGGNLQQVMDELGEHLWEAM